jgi:hypothetical protein
MPALTAAPDLWPKDLPRTTSYPMLRKAVRLWAQGANDVQIAEWLAIPPQAVKTWKESDGWRGVAISLRKELDFDLESSFGKLGFMALDQLEDRLRYGDFYINRNGERARRPLPADQLAKITALLIDRRAEVRHLVDGTVSDKSENKKSDLAMIADLLRGHAGSIYNTQPKEVIDVEPEPSPTAPEPESEAQESHPRMARGE